MWRLSLVWPAGKIHLTAGEQLRKLEEKGSRKRKGEKKKKKE
jgi:hypothetical protein